jgi:hypothetical protein
MVPQGLSVEGRDPDRRGHHRLAAASPDRWDPRAPGVGRSRRGRSRRGLRGHGHPAAARGRTGFARPLDHGPTGAGAARRRAVSARLGPPGRAAGRPGPARPTR